MSRNVVALPGEVSALDLVDEYLFRYPYKMFPVVDKHGLVGEISLNEIKSLLTAKCFEVRVLDICTKHSHITYADSDLQEVLDIMCRKRLGRVIIVDRTKPRRMIGMLSKTDIIRSIEKQRLGV